jgi:hypothetical protein
VLMQLPEPGAANPRRRTNWSESLPASGLAVAVLLQLASRPVDDIDAYADALLTAAVSDTGDDACLLAVRIG